MLVLMDMDRQVETQERITTFNLKPFSDESPLIKWRIKFLSFIDTTLLQVLPWQSTQHTKFLSFINTTLLQVLPWQSTQHTKNPSRMMPILAHIVNTMIGTEAAQTGACIGYLVPLHPVQWTNL